LELWQTKNIDARLLATLIINPQALSKEEMDKMVRSVIFVVQDSRSRQEHYHRFPLGRERATRVEDFRRCLFLSFRQRAILMNYLG